MAEAKADELKRRLTAMFQANKSIKSNDVTNMQSILKIGHNENEVKVLIRPKPMVIIVAYQVHCQLMYLVLYENNTQDMISAVDCLKLWPDLVASFKRL